MEKSNKEKRTVKNAKRDVLGFAVNSKNGFIARELFLNGKVVLNDIAAKVAAFPNKETSERIARSTVKTFLSDLTLEVGTFSPSRGIALNERDGVYTVADKKTREKLKRAYRDFYLIEPLKKKAK